MYACPVAAVPGGAASRRDAVLRCVPWTFRLTAPRRSYRRPRMPRPAFCREFWQRARPAAAFRSRVAVDARSGLAANGHGLTAAFGRALLSMPVTTRVSCFHPARHAGHPPFLMQRASSSPSPDKARWGEGGEFEGREDRSRASRGVLPPLKPFCLQNAETPAVPPGLRHHISPYQGICRPVMTGTVPPVLPFSAVPADRPPAGPGAAAGPSGAGRPRCRSRP